MVLLIVDVQNLITNEKLYNFDTFISNVKLLINKARENNIEVIYVRHDDGVGQALTKGTDGFEIYEIIAPMPDERIFDKFVNSSFNGTRLLEYLRGKGEKEIIVVGLQTEYCIDATVKCGFEHGFRVIVPEYSNSTFDNEFMSAEESCRYYNEFMWKNRYAECVSVKEVIGIMEENK